MRHSADEEPKGTGPSECNGDRKRGKRDRFPDLIVPQRHGSGVRHRTELQSDLARPLLSGAFSAQAELDARTLPLSGHLRARLRGLAPGQLLQAVDPRQNGLVGSGHIDLAQENLDLTIVPRTKVNCIVALRSPIHIKGPQGEPVVAPDRGRLAARGVGALLLGLVNPLLALVPLVDTGPGVQHACSGPAQAPLAAMASPTGRLQAGRVDACASGLAETHFGRGDAGRLGDTGQSEAELS